MVKGTKGEGVLSRGSYKGYVGVFDSGVGGISILRGLVRELPHERFVYYGDSAHAPYGEKTPAQVLDLSRSIVVDLLGAGCKAIVIACNTATSAAAEELRAGFPSVPIVGVEPALKPAVLDQRHGHVLVMATPMTVRLQKFQRLLEEWGGEAQVDAVPCWGLAARIERGNLDSPDVLELLQDLVGDYAGKVDGVVLGCTHYPYVAKQIRSVLGDVPFYDSALGTARQLRRRMEESGILAPDSQKGCVEFLSSKDTPEELALYRRFFQ